MLLTSCVSTYQYCQIYETEPVRHDGQLMNENGKLFYEDSQCVIDYCFWSNGGSADFSFYNKTDEIVYIDLAKSFFVMNGEARDLYQGREWSQSSSESVASSLSYSYGESRSLGRIEPNIISEGATTKTVKRSASIMARGAVAHTESNTVTTKEKQVIAIPPHTKKYVETYNITSFPMLSCDLPRYPSNRARLDYTTDDSPFRFSDIITYTIGDSTHPITVTNEFYVSSVTNYAEPEIVVMKKREEPCENMRGPDYESPSVELFDKVVKSDLCEPASSFYHTYQTHTNKKLYEDNSTKGYTYNARYDAYTTKSKVSMGSLGVFAGVLTIIAVLVMFK